jgi:hypothetical protein
MQILLPENAYRIMYTCALILINSVNDTWLWAGNFSLRHRLQTGSGATQPPIQGVPAVPFPEVKQLGREAEYSSPSSADIKNEWIYTSIPHTSSRSGAQLRIGSI